MKEKYNDDLMKRTDKRENVERIMKVQQYEKEKLMEKIDEKMMKADNIKREKYQLIEQRQLMKKEIEKQKRDMFDKIQKLKQGKIDPNQLLNSLSMDTGQNISVKTDNRAHQNRSVVEKKEVKKLAPVKQTARDRVEMKERQKV